MRVVPALLLGALLCASCTPAGQANDPQLIAHALQLDAPALASSGAHTAFAWAGFDEADVHQSARLLAAGGLQNPVILPLPPTHPFDQQLIAGADGALHLLWLDKAADGHGNRLYSALLGPDLSVQRGPVEVSSDATYRYAALTDGQGGVWAAWSSGNPAEPVLTLGRIDVLGRPLPPASLQRRGEFPALAANRGGAQSLFWRSEGQLWRLSLADGLPLGTAVLSAAVGLWPGDQLDGLWAAPCGSRMCVGWNLTRADGLAESWLSSGGADADQWAPPQRLAGLSWLTPNRETQASDAALTGVAQSQHGLALVTLAGGAVDHVELAAPDVDVMGAPALARAGDAWLLAWAQPGPDSARLVFVHHALNPAR
ncbi:MAG TPA: hypothetical protein VER79_07100 [Candidatus Limnocylindrales bacterium]|nr:hypothetical protein [Candidatus Limnocylindrales bacterium]